MQEMQNILRYKSKSLKFKIILFLFIIISIVGLFIYFRATNIKVKIDYITQPLQKGDLTLSVSATGYLEPTLSVSVGSEVSGTITKVYVDYNDKVKKGEVLAQIDKTKYISALDGAKASLSAQQASLLSAQARLVQARDVFLQDKKLRISSHGGLPSQTTWDSDRANYLIAKAGVATAKAQVWQAKQGVITAKYNLDRTTIYSPINGVILSRNVDPGQTVAASFQTPVLFTIANDLTKMQLQVNVDEADVARVKAGDKVAFSVDAYPNKTFNANVGLVRVNSQIVNGVVTYIAQIDVDNKKLLLYPGMSADANIITRVVKHKFIVPRAALLYIPIKPVDKKMFGFHKQPAISIDTKPHVWILKDGKPVKVYVKVYGNSDFKTAIFSNKLTVGDKLIVMQEKRA